MSRKIENRRERRGGGNRRGGREKERIGKEEERRLAGRMDHRRSVGEKITRGRIEEPGRRLEGEEWEVAGRVAHRRSLGGEIMGGQIADEERTGKREGGRETDSSRGVLGMELVREEMREAGKQAHRRPVELLQRNDGRREAKEEGLQQREEELGLPEIRGA